MGVFSFTTENVMHVTVDHDIVFALIDALLERWRPQKLYPFNRKDAILPQKIIPASIRKDRFALACFYFYTCIYMTGSIESLQAFQALLRLRKKHPEFFDPKLAAWLSEKDLQPILYEYIGWASEESAKRWVHNSRQLLQVWEGDPRNLLKGLKTYDEALLRIKNKLTQGEKKKAGPGNEGFRGFQPKMVSMLIYFYDWEGWLRPRFPYPSPADFHNFRMGLSSGAIQVSRVEGQSMSHGEKISAPWRDAIMDYLKKRKADPVEVADVLWLFSLVMCGNSPVNITRARSKNADQFVLPETSFSVPVEDEEWRSRSLAKAGAKALQDTCLVCPFEETCQFAVPARPYYTRGKLEWRPRPRIDPKLKELRRQDPRIEDEVSGTLSLLETLETPSGA